MTQSLLKEQDSYCDDHTFMQMSYHSQECLFSKEYLLS